MLTVIVVLAVVLASVQAIELSGERHVIYHRNAVPSQWVKVRQSFPEQPLRLVLALKQSNLDTLQSKFESISDPDSSEYGKFMTRDEILSVIAPKPSHFNMVKEWVLSFGVNESNVKSLGDAISIEVSSNVASQMFNTQLFNFMEQEGRVITRQFGEYSIPAEFEGIIELVAGISEFPVSRSDMKRKRHRRHHHHHHHSHAPTHKRTHAPTPAGQYLDQAFVCPQTINAIYNISKAATTDVSQSVIEFQDDSSYNLQDLKTFYKKTDINTTQVSQTIGPFDGSDPDGEATLDIQYISAVGIGAENWYWTEENWMYDFSVAFFNSEKVPDVVSMSWGWSESAQCDDLGDCSTFGGSSLTYVQRTNTEFMKIGLRGVTLLASSGDSGANGRTNGDCSKPQLFPSFPGSSPYVTAVGATELVQATALNNAPSICSDDDYTCAGAGVEQAVSWEVSMFGSGGGFSNYVSIPSWQQDAVSKYLNSGTDLPPSTYFNSTGRGYPDIAAIGNNFLTYLSGEISPVGGTSASAPTIGGIVSILNQVRVDAGQSKLGFINPLLYKMASEDSSTFHDIVVGDNKCTEDGCAGCEGFVTAAGWDPVTGLGTPNVQGMIDYLQKSNKVIS